MMDKQIQHTYVVKGASHTYMIQQHQHSCLDTLRLDNMNTEI